MVAPKAAGSLVAPMLALLAWSIASSLMILGTRWRFGQASIAAFRACNSRVEVGCAAF